MPMSEYRNALLPLISYPQPTLPAAIAGAVEAAAALGVRLTGLDMQIAPPVTAGFGGYAMPFVGATIETEQAKTSAVAEEIAREFEARARERGVTAELRRVTCESLDAPSVAGAAARFFDLSLVPIAQDSRADREIAEGIMFSSGRPCLLLPHYWATQPKPFDRPLIAWDASRSATRAIGDALPLLRRAMEVFLVVVASEQSAAARSMPDIERWLADHGVRANCARLSPAGRAASAAIAEHARETHANLLVMGAFGHSRVRDFILGGVTRSVLAEPRQPVLFSH